MERLRKAGEWIPPIGQSESDYRTDFPVIEIMPQEAESVPEGLKLGIETLLSFARTRNVKPKEIWTMFDIDFVLRDPVHQLSSLCPGRLPDQSIKLLKRLENKGAAIGAFATNQPIEGHQIARVLGRFKDYRPILDILNTEFPDSLVISAEKDWSFLWKRPKTSPEQAETVADSIKESDYRLYAFFGDRYDVDGRFWREVQEQVDEKDDQFVFVKLPNPTIKRFPVSSVSPLIP